MTHRDTILSRIRQSLADAPQAELPPAPEVWPIENPSISTRVRRFAEELEAVTGEVIACGDLEDAAEKLLGLIESESWESVLGMDRPMCRRAGATLGERVQWVDSQWTSQTIAEVDVALVEADALLADTGSAIVTCPTAQDRLLCYLPPYCVVVARSDQLAEHLAAAWKQITAMASEGDRRGESVIITGPSRTADIEKILILGVHGPKRLIVLLIDPV